VNAFGIVRAIISGLFAVAKFAVLSILRIGRWCWDRIHIK